MDEPETLDRRRRPVHRDRRTCIRAAGHVTQVVRHHKETARVIEHRDSGFWPVDVAAGVVGGAVGTAGAIATAPFRSDRYATSDGYYHRYSGPNGFACQPGTTFRGEDGRMHLCQ